MATNPSTLKLSGLAGRLVRDRLISETQAQTASVECAMRRQPFVQYLVEQKVLDSRRIAIAASHEFGVPLMDLDAIDLTATTLALAEIRKPARLEGRVFLGPQAESPRTYSFGARDRCDETVDRIRSVRTDRFLYIRNFHPQRPLLQPNAYKDAKSILQTLRRLHAVGELNPLAEKLLFSPTRPPEELYEWTRDRWQVTNLAGEPAHQETLAALRSASLKLKVSEPISRWFTMLFLSRWRNSIGSSMVTMLAVRDVLI